MFRNLKYFDCDLSKWKFNTQRDINLEYMFYGCTKFKGKGLEKWNTEKFYNTQYMFSHCRKDFVPNISNWNTTNLAQANNMFSYDSEAKRNKIADIIKNWDLTKMLLNIFTVKQI